MDNKKEIQKGNITKPDTLKRMKAYYYQLFSDIEEMSLLHEEFKKTVTMDIEYLKTQIEVLHKNYEEMNSSLACGNIFANSYKKYIQIRIQKANFFQDLLRRFKMF